MVVIDSNNTESIVLIKDSGNIVTEQSNAIIVDSTKNEVVSSNETYNVVVEIETTSTIVAGQPGPQGPVGLSEDSVAYARQTDFVGEDVIYKGEAEAGSSQSSPVWRIRKITIVNDDISETWADGNTNFDNVWANRASLIYL